MVQDFFRKPTEEERRDFIDIGPYKQQDAKSKFIGEMGKKRIEAAKKEIPFFKKAALDDFEEYYKEQAKLSMRKNGYVKVEDIKPIKIDWDKYSSSDNIKLIEIREYRDPHLSKKFPYSVFFKGFRYKYKGYGPEGMPNMTVMEPEEFALKRAKALWDNKPENVEESLAEKQSKLYSEQKIEPITIETDKSEK